MSQYRDPLAGLRSQIATKRGIALDRERGLTPLLYALAPTSLRAAIEAHRTPAFAEGETMAALTESESALDAFTAAVDEVLAMEPRLRDLPVEVPDPAPNAQRPPWLIEERSLLRVRKSLDLRLQDLAGTEVVRRGDFGYLARFALQGVPYVYWIEVRVDPQGATDPRCVAWLRGVMPERFPRLEVRPQGAHHTVAKALHLMKEIETGDVAFDSSFWVTGAARAAAIFTNDVREALLALRPLAPHLVLESGTGTLEWSFAWTERSHLELPDLAITVIAALHAAVASA